jgi:hypothetical protein
MSAALQLPQIWAAQNYRSKCSRHRVEKNVQHFLPDENVPDISVAFYRKHTQKMLQRYLYASMLVGRAPAMLAEPIGRGWATSCRIKSFEDAVIFVLDVERCLNRLQPFDRDVLARIAMQEYTYAEAADLLGFSVRAISYKYPMALDRLTVHLLKAKLLILPEDER